MPENLRPQGKPRWTGISIAFFVIGPLIFIPSGLCTALTGLPPFAISGLSGEGIVLLFGVLPMALGAVLVYAGLKSRRRD